MAGKSLGSLVVDLIAKAGGFVAGMNQAERAANKSTNNIKKDFKSMSDSGSSSLNNLAAMAMKLPATFLKVSAALGTIYAVAAPIKNAIDFADEMRDLSKQTGVAIETISVLNYAAEQSGTTIDSVARSFKIFSKNIVEAQNSSSALGKIFADYKIDTIDQATGKLKSTMDVLKELADVMQKLPEGPEKTALAMNLLGKSGSEMIELLSNGAEGLNDLMSKGTVVTEEMGNNADAFNDTLGDIKKQFSDLFIVAANDLLPTLQIFANMIKENSGVVTILSGLLKGLNAVISYVILPIFTALEIAVKYVTNSFILATQVAGNFFDVLSGKKSIAQGIIASLNDAAFAARQTTDDINKSISAYDVFDKKTKNSSSGGNSSASVLAGAFANARNQDPLKRDNTYKSGTISGIQQAAENLRKKLQPKKTGGGRSSSGGGGKSEAQQQIENEQKAFKDYMADHEKFMEITKLEQSQGHAASKQQIEDIELRHGKFSTLTEEQKKQYLITIGIREEEEKRADQFSSFTDFVKDNQLQNAVLKEQLKLGRELTESEKERIEIQQGKYDKLTDAQKETIVQSIKLNEELEKKFDNEKKFNDYISNLDFEMQLIGKTADEQERLTQARNMMLDGQDPGKIKSAIDKLQTKQDLQELSDMQIDFADSIRSSIKDNLKSILNGTKSFGEALDDVLNNVFNKILDNFVNNFVDGMLGKEGSSAGGWLSGLFSGGASSSSASSGGGFFSNIGNWLSGLFSGGGHAVGGSVQPNSFNRVNEMGMEMLTVSGRDYLLTGDKGGNITPAHKVGGMSQVNNFNIVGKVDRRTEQQIAYEVYRKTNIANSRNS